MFVHRSVPAAWASALDASITAVGGAWIRSGNPHLIIPWSVQHGAFTLRGRAHLPPPAVPETPLEGGHDDHGQPIAAWDALAQQWVQERQAHLQGHMQRVVERFVQRVQVQWPVSGGRHTHIIQRLANTDFPSRPYDYWLYEEHAQQGDHAWFECARRAALEAAHHDDIIALLREETGVADYPALFPLARGMKRTWKAFLGPTNSGKTYAAMELLKAADTGVYLAPLRLMAWENAARLRASGLPCNLVTGEERQYEENAQHTCATIEALDVQQRIDVAVVDEVQWLSDPERGWAWVQAILACPAQTLVLTGSVQAEPALRALAERLGEPLEVVHLERKAPLHILDHPVPLEHVQPGDAIIAFSRQAVLGYRQWLRDHGRSVACIYGALGPQVRQREAERFSSGEADILVATDAIGLGLNLPIQRVLFAQTEKYDGTSQRPLQVAEFAQIAGRAGRFGHAEAGYVSALQASDHRIVQSAMQEARHIKPEPVPARFAVRPPWSVVHAVHQALGGVTLPHVFEYLARRLMPTGVYDATLPPAQMQWAQQLSATGLPLLLQYRYLGCPVQADTEEDVLYWAQQHAKDGMVLVRWPDIHPPGDHLDGLQHLEQQALLLTAYTWLALHFPEAYPQAEQARTLQERAHRLIADALAKHGLRRLCRGCGRKLALTHVFPICNPCHQSKRKSRFEYEPWNDED